MAQSVYNIPDSSGVDFLTNINAILGAIQTINSGATPPTDTQAGMWWGDISDPNTYYLKMRNHTNDGWVSLYAYDVATSTIRALSNGNYCVETVGDQTIEGVKTFSSNPIVPTPTTAFQVATKEYVDNNGETPWKANDTRAKTALNASGTAPIYACRAWVNFNGTGTVAIRASGNVSSITDNGTGDYTVNFTTAMVDANYSVNGLSSADSAGYGDVGAIVFRIKGSVSPTISAVRVVNSAGSGSIIDCISGHISIFR